MATAVALPPRYYLDNFRRLCHTVEAQYGDLLQPGEMQLLQAFYRLEPGAQCLYLRLASRVGPWFRLSRLSYPEIGHLEGPLAALLDAGFVQRAQALGADEAGSLYTRAELRQRFPDLLPAGRDKAADVAALAAWVADASEQDAHSLLAACAGDDVIIAPLHRDWLALLQLLFFGNRRQSLTEFILSDLGIARYPPYALDRAHRLFATRDEVDDYLACAALADAYAELREAGDQDGLLALARSLVGQAVQHPATEGRWWRLFNRVARQLERLDERELALTLYRRAQLPPARERQARVLEAEGQWPAVAALCEAMLAAPWSEEEREAAERILPRARRQLGQAPAPRRRDHFARLDLLLPPGEQGVERAAAQALGAQWQAVHYVENGLINGLFGLAFWEQIFSPLRGAFHNPFQSAPADMFDGDFYPRRRAAIDARLAALAAGDVPTLLLQSFDANHGLQCRWLNWRLLSRPLLEQALAAIPAAHLLALWRRQLFDPQAYRRGFPDLIAFGCEPGDYCMIEVKGPGDALQDSQKRWLRIFAAEGIPAAVAWVQWRDD
ncbi:VRR-NUC domain-containing protein [Parahaliea mediterranea]|uniref:VRR-NUC domain-containing protein n=1 Tax=Parahaliea mediterranea TaxID=651086 RepID=UPI0013001C19|nr:VRR-NUC domain-containing protein [Parahaliea mediterranea]